jgi:hypothetical protein
MAEHQVEDINNYFQALKELEEQFDEVDVEIRELTLCPALTSSPLQNAVAVSYLRRLFALFISLAHADNGPS